MLFPAKFLKAMVLIAGVYQTDNSACVSHAIRLRRDGSTPMSKFEKLQSGIDAELVPLQEEKKTLQTAIASYTTSLVGANQFGTLVIMRNRGVAKERLAEIDSTIKALLRQKELARMQFAQSEETRFRASRLEKMAEIRKQVQRCVESPGMTTESVRSRWGYGPRANSNAKIEDLNTAIANVCKCADGSSRLDSKLVKDVKDCLSDLVVFHRAIHSEISAMLLAEAESETDSAMKARKINLSKELERK